MDSSLRGVTIWQTRPLPAADTLAQRCRRLGAAVVVAPAMAIEPLVPGDPGWPRLQALIAQLDTYTHVIFVSGNAVNWGLQAIGSVWEDWPGTCRCYAIGPTTAGLLADAGIAARRAEGRAMNSEALLRLPELQQLSGQRVLIVRGVGGRGWLRRVLTERGARVDYLEVYRREQSGTLPEQVIAGLDSGRIDFITAASGETVENIVSLVDSTSHTRLREVAVVVPGERVAAIARRCGFTGIIQATNAGDDAMIEAIVTASNLIGQ